MDFFAEAYYKIFLIFFFYCSYFYLFNFYTF